MYDFAERLIGLSVSNNWEDAVKEWEIDAIDFVDEPEKCLCGHSIHEVIQVRNTENNNTARVGNICIEHLKEERNAFATAHKIVSCMRQIQENPLKGPNKELIQYAFTKGLINEWEKTFSLKTWQKRNLSDPQASTRRRINAKIIRFENAPRFRAISLNDLTPRTLSNTTLPLEVIHRAKQIGLITSNAFAFYEQNLEKSDPQLSDKQRDWRKRIHTIILNNKARI